MPKFKFRLATVERLCEAARDERRAQLAEALRLEETLIEHRERLDEELAELLRQAQSAAKPGVIDVDRLITAQQYEIALRTEQQSLSRQRAALDAEIERRREALVAADREVRTLEKLRESQHRRHVQQEDVRDMKALDEVAARVTGGQEQA